MELLRQISSFVLISSWPLWVYAAALLIAGYYLVWIPVYNVYFHPLRKYPGPRLFAASHLAWGFWFRKGYWHRKIMQLHQEYGHIVRVAPDELAFDTPEAWNEIYGRSDANGDNRRPDFFISSKLDYIISADEADQKRMKAVMAPGFSHAALVAAEPIIKTKMDLFIHQLRKASRQGQDPVNLIRWINYLTFDIVGELLLGIDFGCVAGDPRQRAWQDILISNLQLVHTISVCKRMWIFWFGLPWITLWKLATQFTHFDKYIGAAVSKRQASELLDEDDIFQLMRKGRNNKSLMTGGEILANTNLLTFAGSESSANATASLVYRIAQDAKLKDRLLKELRDNFKTEDDITSTKASSLPFLRAVIEEGLRLQPVTPNALWRQAPKEGTKVFGEWVPGNTILSIHHRAMYLAEHNFKRPLEFIPERWMPDSEIYKEFENDRRDAFRPFSYGGRMCPAVTLGYAEMSIIIARLIWSFDISVAEQSKLWQENLQAWILWDKKPLWLYLKPRSDLS